ncbi:MAG: hypothetical protein PUK20_03940 [Firmicutes bacterium]|nr:hypothetical protein [Bacillota bacterium]MDY4106798.1 hypothetical protein [Oscillospiraceae bacterium]
MLYILTGIIGSVVLIYIAEVIVRIWDRLVPPEKESAPTVGAAEGTNKKYHNFSLIEKEWNVK